MIAAIQRDRSGTNRQFVSAAYHFRSAHGALIFRGGTAAALAGLRFQREDRDGRVSAADLGCQLVIITTHESRHRGDVPADYTILGVLVVVPVVIVWYALSQHEF
jgi:hypothetical protein